MNNNIFKITKYFLITAICIALLLMIIVSQDENHIDNCHEEHCTKCEIIQMAQNLINVVQAIILLAFAGFLICVMLDKIKKEKIISLQKTLIFDKVQLNE